MSKADCMYVLGFFSGGYLTYISMSGGIRLFKCRRCGAKTNNIFHKHEVKS